MNEESSSAFTDPRLDPEFSADLPLPRKARGSAGADSTGGMRDRRRRGFGPAGILSLLLAGLFLDFLFDPMLGPMMLALAADIGLALGVMAGAMALGTIGFGLFAAGDRVIAWLRRSAQWPE